MKEKYLTPELEIELFETDDIITVSLTGDDNGGEWPDGWGR